MEKPIDNGTIGVLLQFNLHSSFDNHFTAGTGLLCLHIFVVLWISKVIKTNVDKIIIIM